MIPKFTTTGPLTVEKVLQKLGRATPTALIAMTGKPNKTVLSTIKALHGRGKIHIASYELNKRGRVSRVWAWGDGDDAREPIMVGNKEVFIPRADVAAAWLRNPI